MRPRDVSLVDAFGHPFDDRMRDALITVAPRLERQFPELADASILADVLEETGNRLAAREQRHGRLKDLRPYAFVVARRMAELRAGLDRSIAIDEGASLEGLATAAHSAGTSEEIEDTILAKQLAARLPDAQRRLYTWKYLGLSTDEIAVREGTSTVNIESRWRQVKRRLRRFISRPRSPATTGA